MKPIGNLLTLGAVACLSLAVVSFVATETAAQGKGHGKRAQGAWGDGGFCPPGLAKKGCIPPGQRKKYSVGYRLPDDVYYRTVYDFERYDLVPPPQGHFYGYVDEDILLIRAATRFVVDAVILGALLD